MTDTIISFYKNVKTTETQETIATDLFFDAIRNGKWQDIVLKIRTCKDEEQRRALKAMAPNVTLSGIFSKRVDAELRKHSGLIAIDIDNTGAETQKIRDLLSRDPYVHACFVSIGGQGLCVVFEIDPERHRDAFVAISDYLVKNYQLVSDPTGINESRTRFVSFDPDIYLSDDALVFKKYLQKPKKRKDLPVVFVQDEFNALISEMVRHSVSCVEDYRDWRDIGFGLADRFGESGRHYFHTLSAISGKYDPTVCDKQYTISIQRKSWAGTKRTLATIYYFAKQAGINISSKKTQRIASAASTMKKAGLSADTIAKNLEQFEGITNADEVIQQVMTSNANFEASSSLVDNIRMWLRQNYNLRRNLVTRKIEDGGKVLETEDFNTMFLDAKVMFDKLTYDLFERIVLSNNTPSYHPIRDYLEALQWDGEPRLAFIGGAINSNTGTLSWRCSMVRKWIIGIVSSVYGVHNELKLILVGEKRSGKTEFFMRLLPTELRNYLGRSQLNRDRDDKVLMCEMLVILNDEYGGTKKIQDARDEKDMMAAPFFNLRKAYGRGNERVIRIASLCATCNELDVLDDPDNRRKIILQAAGEFNFDLYNEIPKDQLFAEALAEFKRGELPELTREEIKELDEYTQGKFSKVSMEGELIQKYFYTPIETPEGSFLTTTEVKVHLEKFTRSNLSVNKIGQHLRKLGYCREMHPKLKAYGYKIGRKMEAETTSSNSLSYYTEF